MSELLKPLTIDKFTVKNRLVMPPMATSKSDDKGFVSAEFLDFYREKSAGGYIGLIIVEHSFVRQDGKASHNQLAVTDDSQIEGLKKLSDVIHQNGSKAVMQINHAGGATSSDVTGHEPVGPSAVFNPRKGVAPRELTQQEIMEIVDAFAQSARRVKEAGFDGVEIHSAHGYLLNQFYSPLTNKRTDAYGGDVMSRIKIHLDVIKAVRAAVGDDFTLLLRLGACDYMEGGITIEDSKIAAAAFEKAGVDMLDISGGFCGYTVAGLTEPGYFWKLTAAIKNVVSIPVILTGGITDAKSAEELLVSGKTDMVGVGRAILKDSHWAKQAVASLC